MIYQSCLGNSMTLWVMIPVATWDGCSTGWSHALKSPKTGFARNLGVSVVLLPQWKQWKLLLDGMFSVALVSSFLGSPWLPTRLCWVMLGVVRVVRPCLKVSCLLGAASKGSYDLLVLVTASRLDFPCWDVVTVHGCPWDFHLQRCPLFGILFGMWC